MLYTTKDTVLLLVCIESVCIILYHIRTTYVHDGYVYIHKISLAYYIGYSYVYSTYTTCITCIHTYKIKCIRISIHNINLVYCIRFSYVSSKPTFLKEQRLL